MNQSKRVDRILVRDDGSTDSTPEILRRLALNKSCVEVVEFGRKPLGFGPSFAELMREARTRPGTYYLFADQDDVWLSNKVEITVNTLRKLEEAGTVPSLVCTNSEVVNEELETLHASLPGNVRRKTPTLRRVVVSSEEVGVLGHTMGFNRSLLEAMPLPIPDDIYAHDLWTVLSALALGKVQYVDVVTARYRQHEQQTAGFFNPTAAGWLGSLLHLNHTVDAMRNEELMRAQQCNAVLAHFLEQLSPQDEQFLSRFCTIINANFCRRRWAYLGLFRSGELSWHRHSLARLFLA